MPEPLGHGQRYIPGLDGVRAVAVAAVVAYHLGLPWLPGGLLGVGIFFTLSGYLITDLLLGVWEARGSLHLRQFWARRARRLLPALLLVLAVVSVWSVMARRGSAVPLRGAVLAALGYVSNWYLIFQHSSYFTRFTSPTPLEHLWSLAVEEQFYLLWPWLVLGALYLLRHRQARTAPVPACEDGAATGLRGPEAPSGTGRSHTAALMEWFGLPSGRARLVPMALATLALAGVSAVEMGVLYHPSFDPSRIYEGTDTRAFGLLVGAALAMVWPTRGARRRLRGRPRAVLELLGVLGMAGCVLLMAVTNQYSAFLYRGGLALLSVSTAAVLASVSHPASMFGRLLGIRPLRWLGVRSYGVYLWHYPVIVLTAGAATQSPSGWRQLGWVALTLVLAAASWRFVESPVRQGAMGRAWAGVRSGAVAPRRLLAVAVVPAVAAVSAVSLSGYLRAHHHLVVASRTASGQGAGSGGPGAGTVTGPSRSTATTQRPPAISRTGTSRPATSRPVSSRTGTPRVRTPRPSVRTATSVKRTTTSVVESTTVAPRTTTTRGETSTTSAPAGPALRTGCSEVVHIGDSTSASLVSPNYLPDPAQRLPEEYARVGVKTSLMRIVGGTSVVETLPGDQNAYEMAQALVRHGYHGCWVVALGTNDAADIYVGSNVGAQARVQRMMAVIGHQPVLWVNVKTLLSSGPYSEANMRRWDQALVSACHEFPNLKVFDWAALAKKAWFTDDGIHYNSPGSAPRAAAMADALAAAFPAHGPAAAHQASRSCTVEASPTWHLPAFRLH